MKIDSSTIFMDSAHYEEQTSSVQTSTAWSGQQSRNQFDAGASVQFSISEQAKEMFEEQLKASERRLAEGLGSDSIKDKNEMQNELLKKLMEVIKMLRRGRGLSGLERINGLLSGAMGASSAQRSIGGVSGNGSSSMKNGVWEVTTKISSFQSEQEVTAFRSAGSVKTADGREISFNLEFEMSRSFTQYLEIEKKDTVVMTDPLVINMGSHVAGVSDQKFLFDLLRSHAACSQIL